MEFREEHKEYFKKLKVEVPLFPEKTIRNFYDLNEFYDFIKYENDYWNKCDQGNIGQIKTFFNNNLNRLNNLDAYGNNFDTELNSICNNIKHNQFPCVFSTTSVGKLIKKSYENNISEAEGIYSYLFSGSLYNMNIPYFIGAMKAYNFTSSENAIDSVIKSETDSLQDLHSQYNKNIEEAHKNFIEKDVETKSLTQDYKNKIEEQIIKLQDDNNKLVQNGKDMLDNLIKQIEDTKVLYENQLSLSAPVAYWSNLSKEYNSRGKLWVGLSIGSTVILSIILLIVLYYLPNSLSEVNNKITYDNLRGTIIFALLVSVGVYIIRLFVKLALSSYHLARDAKEREQLTYVYLALIKEKAIETEERNIVLQAIFSRADTGLLKGDSGPTLPDGVVSQVLKNLNK